jgi:hypothetical protein
VQEIIGCGPLVRSVSLCKVSCVTEGDLCGHASGHVNQRDRRRSGRAIHGDDKRSRSAVLRRENDRSREAQKEAATSNRYRCRISGEQLKRNHEQHKKTQHSGTHGGNSLAWSEAAAEE